MKSNLIQGIQTKIPTGKVRTDRHRKLHPHPNCSRGTSRQQIVIELFSFGERRRSGWKGSIEIEIGKRERVRRRRRREPRHQPWMKRKLGMGGCEGSNFGCGR